MARIMAITGIDQGEEVGRIKRHLSEMVIDGKLQPNGHKSAWTAPEVVAVNRMLGVADRGYQG